MQLSLAEPFRLCLKSIFLHLLVCFSAHSGFSSTSQAMLRWSQVPVFFVPNWLRFKWMITTKPVVLNKPRTNARVVWEFADSLHDNFWTMQAGAILQCSFVHVWIRLQVEQSVVVLHWCHLSGSSACRSEIKKSLIQIISFISKIDKRKIGIPNSSKYFCFQRSWKVWNIHRKKPTILTSTFRQSEKISLPGLTRQISAAMDVWPLSTHWIPNFRVSLPHRHMTTFHSSLSIPPPSSPVPNLSHCWLKISKLWKLESLCKKRFFRRICTYMVCRCNSRLERMASEEPPNMNPGLQTKKSVFCVVKASWERDPRRRWGRNRCDEKV